MPAKRNKLKTLPRARLVIEVDISQVDRPWTKHIAVVLLNPYTLALAFKVPASCQSRSRRLACKELTHRDCTRLQARTLQKRKRHSLGVAPRGRGLARC